MFDSLMSRDLRQTLDHFRRSVDQLFSDFDRSGSALNGSTVTNGGYAFTPAVESRWTDDELCLRAILPGVAEKDVKVSVQNDQLVIEGERKAPEGWGHSGYTQMAYGKFYGAVPLPSGLNLNKVSCRLHDGVLDIQIPVAEQMKPRHIPIQSGDSRKAISA
ncbi:MAG TPA: Hsp20/alpha crystallin family protein [Bryobacteraceae bacterium]|nr:Hsp20/alpha crystallin family protein [Bryobacteraceae bacterium]